MDPQMNELMSKFDANHAAVLSQLRNASEKIGALENEINGTKARLMAAEQEIVRKTGGRGVPHVETFGSIVTRHSEFPAIAALANRRGRHTVTVKNTITSLPGSGGALVAPDVRADPVMLARRRPTIRNLIGPGTTNSNLVQFPRQTVRDLQANVVTEGGLKPESNLEFELIDAPVRTIAHWIKASKQILSDASQLSTTIDGELRYGIVLAEETEFLFGDGTGQHFDGIVPQATAFDGSYLDHTESPQRFDYLKAAITQSEVALLPATGIVMNDGDLGKLATIKDANGNYVAQGGPFGARISTVWGVPVVGTSAMTVNHFLVGAFADGSQIYDREETNVEVATENDDDFTHNLCTVLCEERLAFAVKRPQAFIFGTFSTST